MIITPQFQFPSEKLFKVDKDNLVCVCVCVCVCLYVSTASFVVQFSTLLCSIPPASTLEEEHIIKLYIQQFL